LLVLIGENTLVESVMVLVEGIKMRAKRIPKKQLIAAWKTLSSKLLPKVKALQLSDEEFNHVIEDRSCPEDAVREVIEWGRILSVKGTDACVFNADKTEDAKYIILVRKNSYHALDEILLHELSHIARGDL
jgi:hypothetical protein